jgi:hypothetical protein
MTNGKIGEVDTWNLEVEASLWTSYIFLYKVAQGVSAGVGAPVRRLQKVQT